MTEYISREDALNFEMEIEAEPEEIQAVTKGMALYAEHIKKLPPVAVVEPKTGTWIEMDDENAVPFMSPKYYCSCCEDWNTYGPSDYCPNCGAKMET